jgi:hypothetical protein
MTTARLLLGLEDVVAAPAAQEQQQLLLRQLLLHPASAPSLPLGNL